MKTEFMLDTQSSSSLSAKERDKARFMSLEGVAMSDAAKELATTLAGMFSSKRPLANQIKATAALSCDLLRNVQEDRLGYMPQSPNFYTGRRIGFRLMQSAVESMTQFGGMQSYGGHQQKAEFEGTTYIDWRRATRFRTLPAFLEAAAMVGVTPDNWEEHYVLQLETKPLKMAHPLDLTLPSKRDRAEKYRGSTVPIDYPNDPEARRLRDQVVRLNDYFSKQSIGPLQHRGFRRMFKELGAATRWKQGGRLFSVKASDGYQNAKSTDRKNMLINGEPVVELDIRASHLTILHALRGVEFDASLRDPYVIEGLSSRSIAKKWVTMTLGHERFHTRWPTDTKEALDKELGDGWNKNLPASAVQAKVLERLPILADWPESDIRWGKLQYLESCAIIETVETLAFEHDVPCYPVHDSIIVPASQEGLARDVLSKAFKDVVGVSPHLERA